jgi:CRP-like cAMP-binding protein/class 3 adenylate cyclase
MEESAKGRPVQPTEDLGGVHAVLGLDIVAFSTLEDADQVAAIENLLAWIDGALAFHGIGERDYRWSPAGDGGFLTFASQAACRSAVDVAFSVAQKIQNPAWSPQSGKMRLTMALHAGTVTEARELGHNRNIWGTGINMTARILSVAVPGQLLISKQYFDTYIRAKREREFQIGDVQWRTVKHGVQVEVMNANRHDLCLSDEEAKDRRWQAIGNSWRRTISDYRSLIDDAMKSGEPVAALAAGKFLLNLHSPEAVQELCRMIGSTDDRPNAPYPLQTHYLFSLMPPDVLLRVVAAATPRLAAAGAVLCRKGEPAQSCFFPVSGKLVVDVPGQERPIRILPGQIVGEFGLWIPNITRTATVRSEDEGLLLELDSDQFKKILKETPAVADGVHSVIKNRILDNVLKSRRLFPMNAEEARAAWTAMRPVCEKYEKDSLLDLNASVYILLCGVVGITPSNARPLVVKADGTFGAEQVIGLVSDIGAPDGPTATVIEETVAVKFSHAAIMKLQEHEAVGAAWSALCGERLRAIGKAAAAAVGNASPAPVTGPADGRYDLFLSHASEDKDLLARPLYAALREQGVSVWFDEATLELGDSLHRKIDEGLTKCRYGVVILSPRFLSKQWPQRELDGLVARESASGEKSILPVWYELDGKTLLQFSPTLAERLAVRWEDGLGVVVEKILRVLRKG